jgi:tetratricopeptide (TPR) repeat protein
MGVLFVIKIDPSITATPFANVGNVGCYDDQEEEILFSMHSVFRIGQVKQINKNDRLWQVDLILTGDDDPQLHALTESMREETSSGAKGWLRLGQLMIQLGQFNKAEELYDILLKQTTDDGEKSLVYHMLGLVKTDQKKYEEAVGFYEKSIKIKQKILPPTHSGLAASYNNIGGVYDDMGEYSKALSYYEKALEIKQKILPANHPSLATSYNNIGLVYDNIGEYSKALPYLKGALDIRQRSLPPNHPDLEDVKNSIEIVKKKL